MKDGSGDGAGQRYEGDASPFQRPARRPLLQRLIPVSEQVPGYRGGTLRRDLLAGVTVAALALPASLAYAEIAGLSPVIGLYALLLPAIAYALLGSSRQLVVGPDGSVAALVGAAVIPLTTDPEQRASLAAMLALLVGGVFLGARLVRLGWIADYLSRPVLIGYIHGVAAVLIIGQLGKLLGLNISAESPPGGLLEVIREIDEIDWATFAVGATCLAVLLLFGWLFPELPDTTLRCRAGHCGLGCRRAGQRGSGGGRPNPARLAQSRSARRAADRRTQAHPSRTGHLLRRFLRRDPDGSHLQQAATASTCTQVRSWLPWVPRTWPPGSARRSRSAPAAHGHRSTIRWALALSSQDCFLRA